jgi:hypothetical protein
MSAYDRNGGASALAAAPVLSHAVGRECACG